jgi:hypothetical protein
MNILFKILSPIHKYLDSKLVPQKKQLTDLVAEELTKSVMTNGSSKVFKELENLYQPNAQMDLQGVFSQMENLFKSLEQPLNVLSSPDTPIVTNVTNSMSSKASNQSISNYESQGNSVNNEELSVEKSDKKND